jgi:hypothetical protein
MLLHVIQLPFTYFYDLRIAAKLSSVFCAALAFAIFFWFLRAYKVPSLWLWLVVLFAASSSFLYRMSMPRAPSLSLALQIVASYFILKRHYFPLAILCMVFVWTYNAFPTVAALLLIGAAVSLITEKRFDLRLLLAGTIGIVAGLVVNPYFPRNIFFLWNHIVPKIFATSYQTSVGSEWYPYNTWLLIKFSAIAMLSYLGGIFWTNREEWKSDSPRLFWFLSASLYLILVFKSRRFVEYFPPAAVLFCALTFRDSLSRVSFEDALATWTRKAMLISGTAILAAALGAAVIHVRENIRQEPDFYAYKGSAEWLAKNTPAGSMVFNTDWDDFPMLFHFNTHNRYIVGLDADFMRLKDEARYRRYEKITRGKVKDPADEIAQVYHANFVLTDNKHQDFKKKAESDKKFRKRYSDPYTTIYEIIPTEKTLLSRLDR